MPSYVTSQIQRCMQELPNGIFEVKMSQNIEHSNYISTTNTQTQ